jgi:hypothetical protein
MHYVDVARWYARGEYVPGQWHAQGQAFWGVPHPWWIEAHGAFSNGVVFSVTQGHNFGHLAKDARIWSMHRKDRGRDMNL